MHTPGQVSLHVETLMHRKRRMQQVITARLTYIKVLNVGFFQSQIIRPCLPWVCAATLCRPAKWCFSCNFLTEHLPSHQQYVTFTASMYLLLH